MASRWRVRWIGCFVGLLALCVLAAAVVTDVQAHARLRSEHAQLTSARHHLATLGTDVKVTTYANDVAASHRNDLQASVASTLDQLVSMERTISGTDAYAYLQGINLGTLKTCLGGVQSSYAQIAAHDNSQAAYDISVVAGACSTLAGGSSDGLAYPFDFPDPFVLPVGGTYFAYATNSVAGNIQIIESSDLTHWTAVGDALPSSRPGPPRMRPGHPPCPSAGPSSSTTQSGWPVRWRPGVHLRCHCHPAPRSVHRHVVRPARVPGHPRGLHRSVTVRRCQRNALPGVEIERWRRCIGVVVRAARSGRDRTGPHHPDAAAGSRPVVGVGCDRGGIWWSAEGVHLLRSGKLDGSDYAVGVASCTGPLGPCSEPLSAPPGERDRHGGSGEQSAFTDNSGPRATVLTGGPPLFGYPNNQSLYLRRLDLSGPTPAAIRRLSHGRRRIRPCRRSPRRTRG